MLFVPDITMVEHENCYRLSNQWVGLDYLGRLGSWKLLCCNIEGINTTKFI